MKALLTFFFLFFLASALAGASDASQTVYFIIPGVQYFYMPVFTGANSFDELGQYTINLTLFLRNIDDPAEFHANNSANITGTLTLPNGSMVNVTFTNNGANGRYNYTHNYSVAGTYQYNLTITEPTNTYGWTRTQTNVYVGDYEVALSVNADRTDYTPGQAGTITVVATDTNGAYQSGGNVTITILKPDATVWANTLMTDAGSGTYLYSFAAASTLGGYSVTANFTKGSNTASGTTTFNVEAAPTGGGGGGGGGSVDNYIHFFTNPERLRQSVTLGETTTGKFFVVSADNRELKITVNTSFPISERVFTLSPRGEHEVRFVIDSYDGLLPRRLGSYQEVIKVKAETKAAPYLQDTKNVVVTYTILPAPEGYILVDVAPRYIFNGSVRLGETGTVSFEITNLNDRTVYVELRDVVASPRVFNIPAGGKRTVSITVEGRTVGVFSQDVVMALSLIGDTDTFTEEQVVPISYKVVDLQAAGRDCLDDADCVSGKCVLGVCEATVEPVVIPASQETGIPPIVYGLVFGLLVFILLLLLVSAAAKHDKKEAARAKVQKLMEKMGYKGVVTVENQKPEKEKFKNHEDTVRKV